MMQGDKLPSTVHICICTYIDHQYIYICICRPKTGLQRDRLLSYTESRDQRDEQANPDPNPGNPDHNRNPSPQPLMFLSPPKWTLEKSVQQLPARSSTSGEIMGNGFFVNSAIHGCMYTVSTSPSKNLSYLIHKYICHSCKCLFISFFLEHAYLSALFINTTLKLFHMLNPLPTCMIHIPYHPHDST